MPSWFRRFLAGRYGIDGLSVFLVILYGIMSLVMIPASFFPVLYAGIHFVASAFLVIAALRGLSKNIPARRRENEKFLVFFQRAMRKGLEYKQFHIYKCKNCGQKIRIPRGRGRIIVTCPKCKNEFQKNS